MDVSNMKNMVVLRNLPSNIVEEAFVILKSNKKIRKLEKVEKFKNQKGQDESKKDKDYMLKEAEILVSEYISKIENEGRKEGGKKIKNPKKVLRWAYLSTAIAILEAVLLFSS